MTSKEKAIELYDKNFSNLTDVLNNSEAHEFAIKLAILTCGEIEILLPTIDETPPIHRKPEHYYFHFWLGVMHDLEEFEYDKETRKRKL